MAFNWPETILQPQSTLPPVIRQMTRQGPRSMTGREQRVLSDAGFLTMTYNGLWLDNRVKRETYNWVLDRLRQNETASLPLYGVDVARGALNTGAEAELGAAAALRATEIEIDCTGITVVAGNYLNLGTRLHKVTRVTSEPEDPLHGNPVSAQGPFIRAVGWTEATGLDTGTYVVKITPPLREDYTIGTAVSFIDLRMVGELVDLTAGDPDFTPGGFGAVSSLTFREAFP
jgi:hypothetical protein